MMQEFESLTESRCSTLWNSSVWERLAVGNMFGGLQVSQTSDSGTSS
jgi:hypothetical protein